MPIAVCPFRKPGRTWPDDILAVRARRVVEVIHLDAPTLVDGMLELGDHVDEELGFVSRVRLTGAVPRRA